ncbi:quinone oxidoreductase [Ferroglobus placidus DSM 10642]|uniref:Quinone oxidoreductase n=1 Tax=Ferroglobus placidus (strain DSM 10642 / AEDII12DO) TaxID=589924 RepID=D3RZD5_FERPA|nr:NADH-quinone oxidoreductase subunit K [Ferroglobus placidus]ADC65848.1 quinone oxidoreductase [Ferroglobus placidus DSM 10642]
MIASTLAASVIVLMIGYYTLITSRDLIRLLISLELMFAAVFLSLLPLFAIDALTAEGMVVMVASLFTSSSELLVLISAIILFDRKFRGVAMEKVSSGGDEL